MGRSDGRYSLRLTAVETLTYGATPAQTSRIGVRLQGGGQRTPSASQPELRAIDAWLTILSRAVALHGPGIGSVAFSHSLQAR